MRAGTEGSSITQSRRIQRCWWRSELEWGGRSTLAHPVAWLILALLVAVRRGIAILRWDVPGVCRVRLSASPCFSPARSLLSDQSLFSWNFLRSAAMLFAEKLTALPTKIRESFEREVRSSDLLLSLDRREPGQAAIATISNTAGRCNKSYGIKSGDAIEPKMSTDESQSTRLPDPIKSPGTVVSIPAQEHAET